MCHCLFRRFAGDVGMPHVAMFDCTVETFAGSFVMGTGVLLTGRHYVFPCSRCMLGYTLGIAFLAGLNGCLGMFQGFIFM